MPGSVNNGTVRILTQGPGRSGDIYQGCASGLYRQAFLTLGDTALAVRVVSDVIAESARWPRRGSAGEDDVRHLGTCRSRARGNGGQVAAGGAAVHGDQEDVTRAASWSLTVCFPGPLSLSPCPARER